MTTPERIAELIVTLRGKDGFTRERARRSLVKFGKQAVPTLIKLLSDKDEHMRWEACKGLGTIKDPTAAGSLVDALNDRSEEIRWLGAEGLIALGHDAIVPILRALETQFDSLYIRQGAHHVLHSLHLRRLLDPETLEVLDTLRRLGPRMTVALAAHKALNSLQKSSR